MKQNCWEFKKCGREPGGSKAHELGICPATTNTMVDGVHDGKNAGRCCWIIAGTLCDGEKQGSFAMKLSNCHQCDFYIKTAKEEGANLLPHKQLLDKLR